MKKYKIKATLLSPVHIGSGEVYEPTNFVIDKEMKVSKKSGEKKSYYYLYFFKEEEFYKRLPQRDKKEFLKWASKDGEESIFHLWKFIRERKQIAKNVCLYKTQVARPLAEEYEEKLGRPSQLSPRTSLEIFNQFQIQKAIRDKNSKRLYIPGSSMKGAINTALEDSFRWYNNPNIHQELSISDSIRKKSYEVTGYALNKERFENELTGGPKTFIETIFSSTRNISTFEFDLTLKKSNNSERHLEIGHIIESARRHYNPIFDSMFEDDEINRMLDSSFKEEYRNLTENLKNNQFLIRVGKHSGARAVTTSERKIKVKIAQIKSNYDIDKIYIKSENESNKLEELIIDLNLLNSKEREEMEKFLTFYSDEPDTLEDVFTNKNLTISAYLKEETTTWLFSYKDNTLKENSQLPFGWVLCEIEN